MLGATSAFAATNGALFKASCHSFSLLPSTATNEGGNVVLTSFTTYRGGFGFPVDIDDPLSGARVFSSEIGPLEGEPGMYATTYVVENLASNTVTEFGGVLLELPQDDLDGNGLPDIVQLDRPGDANVTGSWFMELGDPHGGTLTGHIRRNAGEITGRYLLSLSNEMGSTTLTGIMRLAVITGPTTILRGGSGFLCVTSAWTDSYGTQSVSMACVQEQVSLFVENIDLVHLDGMFFGNAAANRGVALGPFSLFRDGQTYRAHGPIGEVPETWWEDYSEWTVEVSVPADSDGNGVPDLSDFVPGFPYVRRQPATMRVVAGADVPLSVDAGGAEPLTYQWHSSAGPISGATHRVLVLKGMTTNDAGVYFVTVSNAAGTLVSSSATLTVVPPLVGAVELDWLQYFVPPSKLLIDSQHNLIAGGIRKLTPAGDGIWSASFAARDFALDSTNAVYVTSSEIAGNGYYDILTRKLDSNGSLVWSNRFEGSTGMNDEAIAIAIDGQGNTYVAGNSQDPEGRLNYLLLKYDASGHEQWQRRHRPECNDHGVAALTVTAGGDAYLAGWGATLKYDTSGNVVWVRACTNHWALRLKLDASGNLLTLVSWLGNGYGVLKHNPAGQQLWAFSSTNSFQWVDMVVDTSNHVFIANSGGQITKLNPSGTPLWTANYPGVPDPAVVMVLAVDRDGNVYSTGTIRDNTSTRDTDVLTRKVSPQGTNLWSARYATADTDVGVSIAVDPDGPVYIGATLSRIFPVVLRYLQPPQGASIQPPQQTVAAGATVVLNAFFRGTAGNLSYQWKFQGDDIVGATNATLVLSEAGISNAGEFSVVINDGLGNQSAAAAQLNVEPQNRSKVGFPDAYFVPADSVGVILEGNPGAYCIETSTDLITWTKYAVVNPPMGGPAQIQTRLLPRLFVRALRLP